MLAAMPITDVPMPLSPTPLPYQRTALEPYVSARTLGFHYDKHYCGYVQNLTQQLAQSALANRPLADIVHIAWQTGNLPLFNCAAQAWNHEFYFASLSPSATRPGRVMQRLIRRDFGSREQLVEVLLNTVMGHFGSGWVWLVLDGERLQVVTTANADSPLLYHRQAPLLALDVWEHAYYLDYQHDRRRYVEVLADRLLNWTFAEQQLAMRCQA